MNCTYSSFYISKVSVSASCSRMVDYIKCVADAWSCRSVFICEIRIVEETHAGTFPLWRYSARQISISLKWIGPNICHFLYPFIVVPTTSSFFFFFPARCVSFQSWWGALEGNTAAFLKTVTHCLFTWSLTGCIKLPHFLCHTALHWWLTELSVGLRWLYYYSLW